MSHYCAKNGSPLKLCDQWWSSDGPFLIKDRLKEGYFGEDCRINEGSTVVPCCATKRRSQVWSQGVFLGGICIFILSNSPKAFRLGQLATLKCEYKWLSVSVLALRLICDLSWIYFNLNKIFYRHPSSQQTSISVSCL